MDDISKRKRPHTTAHLSKDINDNKLNIKRQRNRSLPNEMTGTTSTCSTSTNMICSVNETDQLQSKLGELRLSQLPELSSTIQSESLSTEENRRIKYRRLNMTEHVKKQACPSYAESVDEQSQFYQFQVNGQRSFNPTSSGDTWREPNLPFVSNTSGESSTSNSTFNETDELNNWLSPNEVTEVCEAEVEETESVSTPQLQQVDMDEDNQNCVASPSTDNPHNPALGAENNIFSISPDMNALVNSSYNGLPLLPIFATSPNVDGNLPQPAPFANGSTEFDDEGFDEPNENENSLIRHMMTLSSDLEEDFAL